MANYLVTQNYRSGIYPGGVSAGDTLSLDDDVAEAINRDSPGTLVPASEGAEAVKEDRQMKAAPARRDRGGGETMNKGNMKALVKE